MKLQSILWATLSVALAACSDDREIPVQSQFSPLWIADAPRGGAHPIGGPAYNFVTLANRLLRPAGTRLVFHVTGEVHPADRGKVEAAVVRLPEDHPNLHAAVAAGAVPAGIGLSNMNGFPFGELLVASLPFGMEVDEFVSYLYDGGGLALQQQIYDEKFDGNLVVLPVAITPTQGGGWFPEPLPDPEADENLTAVEAMRALCNKPWLVRWPEPGSRIWQLAGRRVGVDVGFIGGKTRSSGAAIDRLTFGGFVFGGLPHRLLLEGQIDAFELNLPYADVMMMKIAQGKWHLPNDEVDLSPIIRKAPYLYGGTWHQPLSYVELLFHRDTWDSLSQDERTAIRISARAATLENLSLGLERQRQGTARLQQAGAKFLRWPAGLLALLRQAADDYLDERAAALADSGDDSYRRVLEHQRDYMSASGVFWDFGDLNQGRAELATSPVK